MRRQIKGRTMIKNILFDMGGVMLVYDPKLFLDRLGSGDGLKPLSEEDNTLLDVVNAVPVKKGDFFFIESGTLHAIGKGLLIAEIQQNSNTTYRIYDYGRVGKDGKTRPLHIDKAVEVTRLCPPNIHPIGAPVVYEDGNWTQTELAKCDYFTVNLLDVANRAWLEATERSFVHILVLEGEMIFSSGTQKHIPLGKGDSLFIPAGYGHFELTGEGRAVMTNID